MAVRVAALVVRAADLAQAELAPAAAPAAIAGAEFWKNACSLTPGRSFGVGRGR